MSFHNQDNPSGYKELFPKSFLGKIAESDSLKKQFLYSEQELGQDQGLLDPIGDEVHSKVPGLIHRYQNRALITITENCPVHCRYCFRRNELRSGHAFLKPDLEKIKVYLLEHPEIEEIILTGGDPLIVSNEKLKKYFNFLSEISSLKFLRIHTKTPIVLPERIDEGLTHLLQKFSERFFINFVLHINHADEWSTELAQALAKISELKIPLLSQSVLLKGVNDTFEALLSLFKLLMNNRVRPYYLHHPDFVQGATHFYLSVEQGRQIYHKLRNCLPGWALPHYVLDLPGGHGKTTVYNPEKHQFGGNLISLTGENISLTEPSGL